MKKQEKCIFKISA